MRIFFIISILIFFSCNPINKNVRNETNQLIVDTLLEYLSGGNGLADIKLILLSDSTFLFDMRILPQPMSDDKASFIHSTGRWKNQNNWTRLTFKTNIPKMNALFGFNYADSTQFSLINENMVDINTQLNAVSIWGVNCYKIKSGK